MRVTNNMLINNMTYNLNASLNRMEKLQFQTATGKKFRLPSDDPISASKSLKYNTDMSKIEQYQRNTKDAGAWMKETETALTEINKVLKRSNDLMIQAANDTNGKETGKIKAEIEELKNHVIQIGNTTYAGRSIFTGYKTDQDLLDKDGNYNINIEKRIDIKYVDPIDKKPFDEEGEILDKDGEIIDETLYKWGGDGELVLIADNSIVAERVEIEKDETFVYNVGVAETVSVNTLGNRIFGVATMDSDDKLVTSDPGYTEDITKGDTPYLIAMFEKLEKALESSNQEDLQTSLTDIKGAMDNILSITAEVGAKTNRLELTSNKLEDQALNLEELLSFNEDIDLAEAYMKLTIEENVYTASLSVGAKIIQPSLVDFLR